MFFTGVELSEKPRFQRSNYILNINIFRFAYFSRVVPPDNLQATGLNFLNTRLKKTFSNGRLGLNKRQQWNSKNIQFRYGNWTGIMSSLLRTLGIIWLI